jgi:WhiB family redox-sensing transcriptional regulator
MPQDWVDLCHAIASHTPELPNAACRGHAELFDAAGRHTDHSYAIRLCHQCPALAACHAWLGGLDPYQRPSGVVAGRLQPPPRARHHRVVA